MKRHGYLFEQIATFDNLLLAARKALRGKKDRPPVAEFYFHLETELLRLEEELQRGIYVPRPYRTFMAYEPKPRRICAADIRDRVVHHAICNLLELLFERFSIHGSYACRKDKGTHRAIRRAQAFSRKNRYFLKLDVRHFFETVDHACLKGLLAPVSQGISFLGFRVFPGLVRLQRAGWVRFRRKVREREQAYREGNLDEQGLVQLVQSLLGHLQHADTLHLRQTFFNRVGTATAPTASNGAAASTTTPRTRGRRIATTTRPTIATTISARVC